MSPASVWPQPSTATFSAQRSLQSLSWHENDFDCSPQETICSLAIEMQPLDSAKSEPILFQGPPALVPNDWRAVLKPTLCYHVSCDGPPSPRSLLFVASSCRAQMKLSWWKIWTSVYLGSMALKENEQANQPAACRLSQDFLPSRSIQHILQPKKIIPCIIRAIVLKVIFPVRAWN